MPELPAVPASMSGHAQMCWRAAFLRADAALGWWSGQDDKVRAAERMLTTGEHTCTCKSLQALPAGYWATNSRR